MKRIIAIGAALAASAVMFWGCATGGAPSGPGWVTLIDGEKGLENFDRSGDANWRAESGSIAADKAAKGGHLVSKKAYKDFELYVEFWADHTTNSGVYMRCADRNKITDKSCYEANIYDQRADPTYGTGGIVHRGPVNPMPKAGGKWNIYEIHVKGSQLTVKLNGAVTSSINNSELTAAGPLALQFGNRPPKGDPGGAIKWRKVMIREL
jgi:hypothetical protein